MDVGMDGALPFRGVLLLLWVMTSFLPLPGRSRPPGP